MTDRPKPRKPGSEAESPAEQLSTSPAATAREAAENVLTLYQLPPEFVERIRTSDMKNTNGVDLKNAALQLCENANAFLARISTIPELSESAQAIRHTLKTLTGDTLYDQIKNVLAALDTMAEDLIRKATEKENGVSYLENTQDGTGTPRVDLEKMMKEYEQLRPLHSEIAKQHISEYVAAHESSMTEEMGRKKLNEFVVRYKRQKELEKRIDAALERGEINRDTAIEILKASTGQMNMAYNPFGQLRVVLMDHEYENALGENEAEKKFLLLDLYSQFLAVTEGFRFIERFYQ